MRVLNINKFFYLRGGVERYYFALTKLLEENGHDVIHFSMKDEKNFPSKFSNYFVENLELAKPGLQLLNQAIRPIWYKDAQKKLEQLLDEYPVDIAHIHLLYHHLSPSILPVLKKRGIPIVMTVHDYKLICPNYLLYTEGDTCKRCKGHRYYNPILYKCLKDSRTVSAFAALEMSIHKLMQVYEKQVDLFIAPSTFVSDTLIEFGQNPKKIMTIPHFLEQTFLTKGAQAKPSKSETPYLLYFGRLSKEKGIDKVLEMMHIYKPAFKFRIAGTGPQQPELEAYLAKTGLQGVSFLGHLTTEELLSQIKGASAVVMPSQFYEPFGFSALETMALGTPLVASSQGALSELVHPDLGRTYPVHDKKAMFRAIHDVMTWDRDLLQVKADDHIKKNYLPEQHYQSLITAYQHLLQS